jgi:hypothetical protein
LSELKITGDVDDVERHRIGRVRRGCEGGACRETYGHQPERQSTRNSHCVSSLLRMEVRRSNAMLAVSFYQRNIAKPNCRCQANYGDTVLTTKPVTYA